MLTLRPWSPRRTRLPTKGHVIPMSNPSLPAAVVANPGCGACGSETRFDGDRFACEDCGIGFDPNDPEGRPAEFLDDEASACLAQCENWWHGHDRIKRGCSYRCGRCALPSGHESFHWTNCAPIPTPKEGTP